VLYFKLRQLNPCLEIDMRKIGSLGLMAALVFLAHLVPAAAQQDGASRPPSPHNETFKKLRAQCEQAACAPAGGDACVEAAVILMGDAAPDEFWHMSSDQRLKISLRLLEKGANNSNLARAHAYDIYSTGGFFAGNSDPYRANELMAMMTASSYPGAALRKARAIVSIFSVGATEAERAGSCELAKSMLAGGRLDAGSRAVAQEILESNYCAAREPAKN
jgi:hypothetical protein